MKNTIFVLMLSILLFSCEKEEVKPTIYLETLIQYVVVDSMEEKSNLYDGEYLLDDIPVYVRYDNTELTSPCIRIGLVGSFSTEKYDYSIKRDCAVDDFISMYDRIKSMPSIEHLCSFYLLRTRFYSDFYSNSDDYLIKNNDDEYILSPYYIEEVKEESMLDILPSLIEESETFYSSFISDECMIDITFISIGNDANCVSIELRRKEDHPLGPLETIMTNSTLLKSVQNLEKVSKTV